jgi:hypothetical protein
MTMEPEEIWALHIINPLVDILQDIDTGVLHTCFIPMPTLLMLKLEYFQDLVILF